MKAASPSFDELTLLRAELYYEGGRLYGMRRRDVPVLVGEVIRRRAHSRSALRSEWIRQNDITLYLQRLIFRAYFLVSL